MQTAVTSSLLYLDNVIVSFDGFKALNGLSLAVDHSEMRAIIGPNGAGKTTMMDVITGKTRPSEGTALLEGSHDLTALDEAAIAELGIGRKFQTPTVFDMHRVEDNLLLALKEGRSPFATLFSRRTAQERQRIDALLERVRLTAHRRRKAGELSPAKNKGHKSGWWRARDHTLWFSEGRAPASPDQKPADTADLLRSIA